MVSVPAARPADVSTRAACTGRGRLQDLVVKLPFSDLPCQEKVFSFKHSILIPKKYLFYRTTLKYFKIVKSSKF
jgi:hypothetical protein